MFTGTILITGSDRSSRAMEVGVKIQSLEFLEAMGRLKLMENQNV